MSGSPMDRLLKRAVPRPLDDVTPLPRLVAGDVYALDRELLHFGMARMPARSTLLRLSSGNVVVVSPPPLLDDEALGAIEKIGEVSDVVVPNPFHYLYAREVLDRFPKARLLTAPGVAERVPALAAATLLADDPPVEWNGEVETAAVGSPGGSAEVAVFHRASATLALTDLAFNLTRYPRALDRFVWRSSGIPATFGPGRTTKTILLKDRVSASASLARIASWPFERIVLAHGDVVEDDARLRFRQAFAGYLP